MHDGAFLYFCDVLSAVDAAVFIALAVGSEPGLFYVVASTPRASPKGER